MIFPPPLVLVGLYNASYASSMGCESPVVPLPASTGPTVLVYELQGSELILHDSFDAGPNPSWIVKHPHLDVIYALNEVCNYGNSMTGSVTALQKTNDGFVMLNRVSSGGGGPVFASVSCDASSQCFILVSSYSGGNLTSIQLHDDGRLGQQADQIAQGFGSHSVYIEQGFAAAGRRVYAPVLGSDRIDQYLLRENGTFGAASSAHVTFGPRHMAFAQSSKVSQPHVAYIADEGNATTASQISICEVEADGQLTLLSTQSTLPDTESSLNMYPAEIHVAGDELLLVSNRDATTAGRDSIVVYNISLQSLPKPIGFFKTGHYPRSFSLGLQNRLLVVANQKGNSVMSMNLDINNGQLHDAGLIATPESPAFVDFFEFS